MKKLDAADIKFIDNYLKNSGVEFLDVRMEMIDHVASAIEDDLEQEEGLTFYTAFKSYMIQNKSSLLKNATKHRWSVDLKVLRRIGKNLLDPYVVLGMLLFSTGLLFLQIPVLEDNLYTSVFFVVIILCTYIIPFFLYYRNKISFLNRLAMLGYLLNYIFLQVSLHSEFSHDMLYIFYGIVLWINISVLRTTFEMSAHYRKQFSEI